MAEQFLDAMGIPFERHAEWLPNATCYWPHPKQLGVKIDDWRSCWVGSPCWWCGNDTHQRPLGHRRGTLHHLRAGMGKAKINEPWLFTWLCYDCHQGSGCAVCSDSLGRLLWLKWLKDRPNTFWYGTALRLGYRLPDLEPDFVGAAP